MPRAGKRECAAGASLEPVHVPFDRNRPAPDLAAVVPRAVLVGAGDPRVGLLHLLALVGDLLGVQVVKRPHVVQDDTRSLIQAAQQEVEVGAVLERLVGSKWVTVKKFTVQRTSSGGVASSTATVRAKLKKGTVIRAVLPKAQAGRCYLAGFTNTLKV